jgi:uncharacterized glyoxalase superfamily protein PhnB
MRQAMLAASVIAFGLFGCKEEARSPLREAARASMHGSEMSHAIPIFNVHRLRASQAYYRDILGFKLDWEDGDPPDFGSVTRGDATLFMCQGCQGNPGAWIMVFTHDVDKLYEEIGRKGAIVRMPPTDMPWRLREMHVSDRDGNVIRFASETKH